MKSLNILVTGTNGFVGSHAVKRLLEDGHRVFATSRSRDLSSFGENESYSFSKVDLTDLFALNDLFTMAKPDVVVHCAAMSKPDECELNQADAYAVNVEATVKLLLCAEDYKSHFIHISTDFIFNGETGMHLEDDLPDPISYYGRTKLEAEEAVREYIYNWVILRIVFVYGKTLHGRDSFITMIAKKLQQHEPYKLVDDQVRTPTYVEDLSAAIARIIEQKSSGVYNICGKDEITPYQMALQVAEVLNIREHQLQSVTCAEFEEIARRPLQSGLNISKARKELGYDPVPFEEGVRKTLGFD